MTRKQVTAASLLKRQHLRPRTFRRAYQRALRKEIIAAKKRKLAAQEAQQAVSEE